MHLAYSYLRFSSPQQATGDSIRRQTAAREAWLAAHPEVRLDTALVMTDAGRSAFKRKHWDTYALAQFVERIKSGDVKPGSFLLVENLDRLSREDAGEATELFLSIVNKGVVIVQLAPGVMEFRRPVNVQSLMFAIVELSRGHSESAMKSERSGAAWANKRKHAAERVVTRRLPGWVVYDEAARKLVLDPDKAATVRRVYAMAREGYGSKTIAKTLNAEGVPVIGRTVCKGKAVMWSEPTVYHLLQTRTPVGEFQPCVGRWPDRKPVGDPVRGYYPAVITDDEWHATQAAVKRRAVVGRGRRGKHINLFAGLLVHALDGQSLSYNHRGTAPAALVPLAAKIGRVAATTAPKHPAPKKQRWTSFQADPFDTLILSRLVEVTPADVGEDTTAAQRVEALEGKEAELAGLIRQWKAKMDNPAIVDTVAAKLAELTPKHKAVAEELEAARQEVASPIAEAWGEFRSLADLMKADPSDELRVRVRAALRRAIDRVYCVFSAVGAVRLAAVRVQFRTDRHRDYVLSYRPAVVSWGRKHRDAWQDAATFAEAGAGPLDLRDPKDSAKAERFLRSLRFGDEQATAR